MLLLEGARSWDRFSTDGDALTSLRNSVSDPEGALISWDPQVSFCTWFRVKCNDTERIERLYVTTPIFL
ncbi:Leucine-rich repeat protein 2 [Linum grandiflorum]